MSRNSIKKNSTIVATTILALSALSVLLAPAGFGGTWKRPTHTATVPIIDCVSPTTTTSTTTDFAVSTGTAAFFHHHVPGSRKTTSQTIQIFSDPAGITYNGPMSGDADVVAADVDPSTPAGQATVYLETQDGQIASTTIVVQ